MSNVRTTGEGCNRCDSQLPRFISDHTNDTSHLVSHVCPRSLAIGDAPNFDGGTFVVVIFSVQPAMTTAVGVAGIIALGAWRSKSLTQHGACAAFAVGVLAMRVGWAWGAFLIAWFALAALISRIGRRVKLARMCSVVEKGAERDARQVLANGGVFALCALQMLIVAQIDGFSIETHRCLEIGAAAAAAGALAAAGADTWATEFGTLIGGTPWSLRERRRVAIGTSGALSVAGSLAAIVGGIILATLAAILHMIPFTAVPAVALSAVLGAFTDSILGAWWQERRWCPQCVMNTEQVQHVCGMRTERVGGVGSLDNDVVNFLCTLVGAGLAAATVLSQPR